MSASQQSALTGMMFAILEVKDCPPDIHVRAEALLKKLNPFAALFRLVGR